MVMLRLLSRAPVFLAFPAPPPLLLLALNLPRRLVAAADTLSGMVDTDLLLLGIDPLSTCMFYGLTPPPNPLNEHSLLTWANNHSSLPNFCRRSVNMLCPCRMT
jgi:hypothetical protein